ncbi:GNAT family N-acetyltransferase [Chitinimonas viridis]|uniref:GNAT family N-acetyltransferase n=1 Tax=Chitinimonas viridis TaxID=664880 RepID=A0ABT8AZP6_9NEIS|nr:GNAT family N-acetyltransferase [Chitinimonas viridis]MDN3575454.1 GNAT family N-acetyltransferase [Chitinimonas viridis]
MSTGLRLTPASPSLPEARRLIRALDDYLASLYPGQSNHLLDVAALEQPGVSFYLGWLGDKAVACGAIVAHAGYVELKRMYVDPQHRGQGIARALLAALEATARETGKVLARLETGIHQAEAIALYRACGFAERTPFGSYAADPLSLFMEKPLE